MPTKNPRLSVVLSPALSATLTALAHESGESSSSLVRGLLEQSRPGLERMLHLLRAANAAKGQIGSGVGDVLLRVHDDLERALLASEARIARVESDLVSQAEAFRVRKRPSGGRSGAAAPAGPPQAALTPVPVTRGSGMTKEARKPSKGVRRVRSI